MKIDFNTLSIIFSGLSFLIYGISFFVSAKMKNEFKRYGLEKYGSLIGVLELLGGLGLLTGLFIHSVLFIAAGGLAVLMLMGFIVRIKIKDGPLLSIPAFFFMLLNTYIFMHAVLE